MLKGLLGTSGVLLLAACQGASTPAAPALTVPPAAGTAGAQAASTAAAVAPTVAAAAQPAATAAAQAAPAVVAAVGTAAAPVVSAANNPAGPFLTEDSAEWKTILEAAKKEKLVVYGSPNPLLKDLPPTMQQKFGVAFEFTEMGGTEALDRMHAERDAGKLTASVVETGDSAVYPAYKEGSLEVLKGLPNGARIHPEELVLFTEGGTTYWPVWDQIEGIVYNGNLLPDDQAPKSYQDLVDPRFKGKITVLDPSARLTAFFERSIDDPEFGEAFHKKLAAQDLLLARSGPDTEAAVARGERWITPGPPSAPKRQAGANLKWKPMGEGVFRSVFVLAIFKDAPAPNAARVFINHVLSPEYQTEMASKLGETPATMGIAHPQGLTHENLRLYRDDPVKSRQAPQGNPDARKRLISLYGR